MTIQDTTPFPECDDCGDSGMVHVGDRGEDFCCCEVGQTLSNEFYTEEEPYEDDAWADSDALASAGMGTDEDYGCYDSGDYY